MSGRTWCGTRGRVSRSGGRAVGEDVDGDVHLQAGAPGAAPGVRGAAVGEAGGGVVVVTGIIRR